MHWQSNAKPSRRHRPKRRALMDPLSGLQASAVTISALALDRAEFGRQAGVENAHPLCPQQRQEFFRFLVADDELDDDCHLRGELEEMLFVQDAVAAEAGDRAERRTAVDARLLRRLEAPPEKPGG